MSEQQQKVQQQQTSSSLSSSSSSSSSSSTSQQQQTQQQKEAEALRAQLKLHAKAYEQAKSWTPRKNGSLLFVVLVLCFFSFFSRSDFPDL
jgi:hypothetical protein